MSDDDDDFFDALQRTVEENVREQLARHHRVDPTISRNKVIDIQIDQERQKLEKLADKWDEEEKGGADALRALANDWLPALSAQLKGSN